MSLPVLVCPPHCCSVVCAPSSVCKKKKKESELKRDRERKSFCARKRVGVPEQHPERYT